MSTLVYATLLTNLTYLPGVLVLQASLKRVSSVHPLVVFVVPGLSQDALAILESAGLRVVKVEWLEPTHKTDLDAHDARFADTWTKLAVFGLTDFERIVLLDSDMLVIRNVDNLLTMALPEDHIAAAHACTCNPRKLAHYPKDWVPENCAHTYAQTTQPIQVSADSRPTFRSLNSGLVVLRPSAKTFAAMRNALDSDPIVQTFKFPDQDFMAHHFRGRFIPLGYQYNALKTLRACHRPMWRDEDVRIVHFILSPKPWQDRSYQGTSDEEVLHSWWWEEWDKVESEWREDALFQSAVLPNVRQTPTSAPDR